MARPLISSAVFEIVVVAQQLMMMMVVAHYNDYDETGVGFVVSVLVGVAVVVQTDEADNTVMMLSRNNDLDECNYSSSYHCS